MGGSGSKKPQSVQAPLCGFSPPHFAVAGLASQALIRNRKTSQLPRTLYEIGAKRYRKYKMNAIKY